VLVLRLIERDRGIGFDSGADILGAVLITAALMLAVYAIVTRDAGLGAVSALLVAFVATSSWSPSWRARRWRATR
jgi:hypothetical protein